MIMLSETQDIRLQEFEVERRMRKDQPISQRLTFLTNPLLLPSSHQMPIGQGQSFGAGWLGGSLKELQQIDEEAAEEEYPTISEQARGEARRLLFAIGTFPIGPVVYPSVDGGVAIYFKSPTAPSAILVIFDNDGGGASYTSINGKTERRNYRDSAEIPDEFLKAKLRFLGRLPLSQILDG